MLAKSAACGLISEGVAVDDAGEVPTPVFATYLTGYWYDGGIMITGSHMPPDRIGIIVMLEDGSYAQDEVARAIEAIMYDEVAEAEKGSIPHEPPHPREIGEYRAIEGATAYYLDEVVRFVDSDTIAAQKYKVLADPGNGTACGRLVTILERVGCQTIEFNHTPKPEPNREAEPRARNLGPTADAVVENGCDIGVATDVDADRVLFITADGEILSEDVIGAIFASSELDTKEAGADTPICVTPVNSSGLIEAVCGDMEVPVEYCRIGQPDTARALKEFESQYSYEESGKYYFARHVLWADSFLATLKLLELMANEDKSLAELAAPFPVFEQVKQTVRCADAKKQAVMATVQELWVDHMADDVARDVTIDGLKRVYNDRSWLLIRASGTEPLIRVYSDAQSEERAQELVKGGLKLVGMAMEQIEGK